MTIRPLPFLLALMCLATTIAPAVADTPTGVDPTSLPPLYADVLNGKPGALTALQATLMHQSLRTELQIYAYHTGEWPESGHEALAAGLLPFVPADANGLPVEVQVLALQEAPTGLAVGLRLRSTDATLIRMGADGDPLTPVVESIDKATASSAMPWTSPYPWSARFAAVVESALISQCEAVLQLTAALPSTPESIAKQTGMVPRGWQWQATIDPAATGVALEIDPTHTYLRTTIYPVPGLASRRVYGPDPRRLLQLAIDPYGLVLIEQWQPVGMLTSVSPLPPLPPAAPIEATQEYFSGNFVAYGTERTASWILMLEYARLAAWLAVRHGQAPTTEWLVEHELALHAYLNADDEPVRPTAIPIEADIDPRKLAGRVIPPELDGEFLLQVSSETVMVSSSVVQEGLSRAAEGNPKPRQRHLDSILMFDVFNPFGFGSKQPLNTLLPEVTTNVMHQLGGDLAAAPDAVEHALWTEHEKLASGFSYLYLALAGQSIGRCLQSWLVFHPTDPIPPWPKLLQELRLSMDGYREIDATEPPGVGEGWLEAAVSQDHRCLRIRMRHPAGLERVFYERATGAYQHQVITHTTIGSSGTDGPEFTVLDYTPVATFSIPIPEVPAP